MQKIFTAVLLFAVLAPAAVWAQQKSAIELRSLAEVETIEKNEKGEQVVKRTEVSKAPTVPGSVVVFTTKYTNTGKQPAHAVVVTNPVSEYMAYIEGSAEGSNTAIEFSVDSGKTYNAPDKLTVKDPDGTMRKAKPADFTHIRWTLTKPIAPGGIGSVSFKAKIK